ncbi:Large conductance mechanosensitive channel protein [Corynebacterium camporealensis]|uniref:Large-conductance mechanosensitive channel n=1 Tax=Corynebacterium camporealensis TaxID=161896 RepID=A0A0F6QXL4_9CORY|nr:large conductance mechanosensitive channel protein MscL [Corynebacterium camporealensis]AKE38738.1 large conductance mechanosensitive channel protein [Corynebacterium camporealensis]AVH88016.1 Large conductance mechanosensitive channel protein [Corynebacterium camporealensis]
MLKGFKDFILRGNVVELAVAVIIGAAFTSIVTAVTDNLIQPILNVFGSAEVPGFGPQLTDNPNTLIDFGAIISAALNFLIVAAVIYFLIITPINKANDLAKRRMGVEPESSAPTTEDLLAEIRDLLQAQNGEVSSDVDAKLAQATEAAEAEKPATTDGESAGRHRA